MILGKTGEFNVKYWEAREEMVEYWEQLGYAVTYWGLRLGKERLKQRYWGIYREIKAKFNWEETGI